MKLIYSICILALLASCSSPLVTSDSQNTQYTFGVATQADTRTVALTEDEKKIENLFIAIYDGAGQLIEHKVVKSTENINFSVPTSITPTTVYVITNTECDYVYKSGDQVIDFSNNEALKIYFANLESQNQVTLSHKTNSDKEFVITRKTPLPMVGSSAIASSGRTTVTVKLAVARVDIINSNPLQSINAIQISGLTNRAVLATNKDKQNSANDSKINESFKEPQHDHVTYYTPMSYTDNPVVISIDYTDSENNIQNFSKNLKRLLGGSYYAVTINQIDKLSVDVTSLAFDQGIQEKYVTIEANVPWEIISTSGKFSFSTLGGVGNATVTVTSSINNSTTAIDEDIMIQKLGDPTISATINITQNGVNYAFMPNDLEMVFESGASSRTLTIDRIATMGPTAISNNTGASWIRTSKTTAELQEVYTITVDANNSDTRETTLVVRDNASRVIRRITIKQKSGIPRQIITLKAGNTTLDNNTLNVAAIKTQTALELTQQQAEDGILTFKMRYAGGTGGDWWRMKHYSNGAINSDEIWHNRPGLELVVDENFGEQRSVDIELYDIDSPLEPYKSFTVTQAAAVDYFSLSSNFLSLDLWGNIYFQPYELGVKANKEWTIEQSYADWITVSYDPNVLTGNVHISVKKNGTGVQRTTSLKFISNGNVVKEFPITQSSSESGTFNLNYKLDLEFNTTNNRFKGIVPNSGEVIYASRLEIADNHASDDKTVKFRSDATYGYVVDAPNSFNKVVATGLTDPAFYIKAYKGQQVSIGTNDMIIGGQFSWSFNRLIKFYLPFPAGVKQDEIVVFKVVVNNLTLQNSYDTPIITHTIEKQIIAN